MAIERLRLPPQTLICILCNSIFGVRHPYGMMLRLMVGTSLMLSVGCSLPWRHSAVGCSSPPANATPVSAERVSTLTGRFRLTLVTTSFTSPRSSSELTLRTPDSVARAGATVRALGHQPRRDLRLVGEWHWSAKYPAERAEWDSGTLYLGCRDCLDASPDHLRIESIDPAGFAGTWADYQTGIAHVVDDKGKPLPDPAGYFCAVRVDGSDH
jgi:hypothetical protein